MKTLATIFISLFSLTVYAQANQEQTDTLLDVELREQLKLAVKYLEGDSVEQNTSKAIELLTDAADKGSTVGQTLLGNIYTHNDFNVIDYAKACHYYTLAANKDDRYAQMNLAQLYRDGLGTTRDIKRAFELMSAAASDDSLPVAKLLLAQYYYVGWGTERDSIKAVNMLVSLKGTDAHAYANQYLEDIKGDTISLSNYDFQFRWLPSVLFAYAEGRADETMLTDVYNMRLYFEMQMMTHFDFDWNEITATMHHCKNQIDIVLYRMPYPKRMPNCLFIAALIDRSNNSCSYYTLEKTLSFDSDNDKYMLCRVTPDGRHENYGMYNDKLTEERFMKRVIKMCTK